MSLRDWSSRFGAVALKQCILTLFRGGPLGMLGGRSSSVDVDMRSTEIERKRLVHTESRDGEILTAAAGLSTAVANIHTNDR